MPEKDLLESILDILQRRDTREIFAQPVDGEEVEGYYDVIKEPMDFGTMRAKLQEGMYTTLEQFEKDVFLISSNAMLFNSSTTIFFRQARAIHELAKRVFHTLKTDPGRIEDEFSQTRKRPGRKPQGEAGISRTRPTNLRRNAQACPGASSSDPLVDRRDNAVLPGSGDGRNVKFCRHQTYKPRSSLATENEPIVSTVYNCSKQLIPGNGGLGYKQSLLQFVKHLGSTAQMVAQKKIGSLTEAPIYQSQKSNNSVEYTGHLISFPAAQQGQTDIHHAASKGKNVFTGEGMDILGHFSGGMKAYASDRVNIDAASKGKSVQTGEGMEIHGGTCREWIALTRGRMATHGATSKGKNVVTGGSMDIHGGTCGRNVNVASNRVDLCRGITSDPFSTRNTGEFSRPMVQPDDYMSLLLQAAGEDITARIPEPCGKYMTAPTMVVSSQLGDQIRPVQLVSRSQSRLIEFMSRGNQRPRSVVHPSTVILPSSLSQINTLSHALDCHSLGGLVRTNAQVSQTVEWNLPTPWGLHPISNYPHVQPRQLLSVPYIQADQVNPMGHESQLPSASFTGQLSTGLNPLGDTAFL
ncbi:uncharacterized protein LOC132274156 isoform X2 [Cornus florida]|nr:uncharacterized protein LOC132274156 isoform X2 [Cornus florida]